MLKFGKIKQNEIKYLEDINVWKPNGEHLVRLTTTEGNIIMLQGIGQWQKR